MNLTHLQIRRFMHGMSHMGMKGENIRSFNDSCHHAICIKR